MKIRDIILGEQVDETTYKTMGDFNKLGEKVNPKYLGPTEKVANISPVLKGKWGKKQKKLADKFFGAE